MDTHDFVIIGAGPAGEAAAHKARALDATVAVIDRRLFGGSCPHIGCLPSKSLLADAARHHANEGAYDWPRASAHRDFMINRAVDAPEPDDRSHVAALTRAGVVVYRGSGVITGRGRVSVRHDDVTHELAGTNIVIVDPRRVFYSDAGLEVDYSEKAMLEMADPATNPVTAAVVLRSLWQENLVGFRLTRFVSWGAAPNSVAYSTMP